jgi:hypothetical protein
MALILIKHLARNFQPLNIFAGVFFIPPRCNQLTQLDSAASPNQREKYIAADLIKGLSAAN